MNTGGIIILKSDRFDKSIRDLTDPGWVEQKKNEKKIWCNPTNHVSWLGDLVDPVRPSRKPIDFYLFVFFY